MFNHQTSQDIIFWVKEMTDNPIENVERVSGRGNSAIYKINDISGKSYVLKHYPDLLLDERPRLETEFSVLSMLHKHGFKNVPKPIEMNNDLNLGLYEWVDGERVVQPLDSDLAQAIGFIKKLDNLSKNLLNSKVLIAASEACLSAVGLISQIEERFKRLNVVKGNFPALSSFLKQTFEPLWKEVKEESYSLWPFELRDSSLPKEKQMLSPSDFGFHNALRGSGGKLTFIDFDYFGWDDPVKLTADFIWHPAMILNRQMTEKWKGAMLELFSGDPLFEDRLHAAMPLYGLRWAMIILNEFLHGYAERRKEAGNNATYVPEKLREIQLNKAKRICDKVKAVRSQIPLG